MATDGDWGTVHPTVVGQLHCVAVLFAVDTVVVASCSAALTKIVGGVVRMRASCRQGVQYNGSRMPSFDARTESVTQCTDVALQCKRGVMRQTE